MAVKVKNALLVVLSFLMLVCLAVGFSFVRPFTASAEEGVLETVEDGGTSEKFTISLAGDKNQSASIKVNLSNNTKTELGNSLQVVFDNGTIDLNGGKNGDFYSATATNSLINENLPCDLTITVARPTQNYKVTIASENASYVYEANSSLATSFVLKPVGVTLKVLDKGGFTYTPPTSGENQNPGGENQNPGGGQGGNTDPTPTTFLQAMQADGGVVIGNTDKSTPYNTVFSDLIMPTYDSNKDFKVTATYYVFSRGTNNYDAVDTFVYKNGNTELMVPRFDDWENVSGKNAASCNINDWDEYLQLIQSAKVTTVIQKTGDTVTLMHTIEHAEKYKTYDLPVTTAKQTATVTYTAPPCEVGDIITFKFSPEGSFMVLMSVENANAVIDSLGEKDNTTRWDNWSKNSITPEKNASGAFKTTVSLYQTTSGAMQWNATVINFKLKGLNSYLRFDNFGWIRNSDDKANEAEGEGKGEGKMFESTPTFSDWDNPKWDKFKTDIKSAFVYITFASSGAKNLTIEYDIRCLNGETYKYTYTIKSDYIGEKDLSNITFTLGVDMSHFDVFDIHGGSYGNVTKAHTEADVVYENEQAGSHEHAGSRDAVVYCSDCGFELSREWDGVEGVSVSLTLDSTFMLNVKFYVGEPTTVGGYLKVEKTVYQGGALKRATDIYYFKNITEKELDKYSFERSVVRIPVSPLCFSEGMTFNFYNTNGDLIYDTSKSVKEYCEYICKSDETAAKNSGKLAIAVLNYAASIQQLSRLVEESNYANRDVDFSSVEIDEEHLSDALANINGKNAVVSNGIGNNIKLSASLEFNSSTYIKFKVKLADNTAIDQYTFTINGDKCPYGGIENGYYVFKKGLEATELCDDCTLVITHNTLGTTSVTYSTLCYAQKAKNTQDNINLLRVMLAMQLYNQAAKVYKANAQV